MFDISILLNTIIFKNILCLKVIKTVKNLIIHHFLSGLSLFL
jgi:hypothetical protein